MRKLFEMYTASRMQNMVQIRKKTSISWQTYFLKYLEKYFDALGVESPHGGAMKE